MWVFKNPILTISKQFTKVFRQIWLKGTINKANVNNIEIYKVHAAVAFYLAMNLHMNEYTRHDMSQLAFGLEKHISYDFYSLF